MNKSVFSIVVPVYNAAPYLSECIDSILNQTLDFKKNIQLILVNDGSSDGSGYICEKYKKRFPHNIVYISKNNRGVSDTRNIGIDASQGEFICFIDSDDKVSANYCSELLNYFVQNKEINICYTNMMRFNGKGKERKAYYQEIHLEDINKTATIDTRKGNFFWPYCTALALRRGIIGARRFNTKMRLSEDSAFMNPLVFDNRYVGVAKQATYYHRKGHAATAVTTLSRGQSLDFFFSPYIENIIPQADRELSQEGKVSDFLQNYIIYQLLWRMKNRNFEILSQNQYDEFVKLSQKVAGYLDDERVQSSWRILRNNNYTLFVLALKYKTSISEILKKCITTNEGILVFITGTVCLQIFDLTRSVINIDLLKTANGNLVLEGWYPNYIPDDVEDNIDIFISLEAAGKSRTFSLERTDRGTLLQESIFNKQETTEKSFKVEIPLAEITSTTKLHFMLKINNHIKPLRIHHQNLGSLSSGISGQYKKIDDKHLLVKQRHAYLIKNATLINATKLEMRYLGKLLRKKKRKALGYRVCSQLARLFHNKRNKIWLISDRGWNTGDNGDWFYRYTVTRNEKNIKPYFIITRDNPRYKELKRNKKPVVAFRSFKYKMLMVLADKRISTHSDEYVTKRIFGNNDKFLNDLYDFDFIYLKHAVSTNLLGHFMNKWGSNINLITCAAEREERLLTTKEMGYATNDIVVTGFPRFDALLNNDASHDENIIMLAPTWRSTLAGKKDRLGADRGYNPDFTDSDYFRFYSGVLSNKTLLSGLEKLNYKIILFLHPAIWHQSEDFLVLSNSRVEVALPPHDYVAEMLRAKIMITDYSGVAFDFAYQHKPLIYSQFDIKTIYSNTHIFKMSDKNFDYEKEGFGPVATSVDEVVSELIKLMQNGAKMEKEYLERAKNFFAYHDGKSAERIYDAIIKYDKDRNG